MTKTAVSMALQNAKDSEVIAVIVSAIVAMGYSEEQISLIRPVVSGSWRLAGRLQAL